MHRMAAFGRKLRLERERRGLARSEVAEVTSIYIHDLAALEFEDFSLLHGDDVVVERFVRTYAEFLELDVDAMVEDYRRSWSERVTRAEQDGPGATEPEEVSEAAPDPEPSAAPVEPQVEEPEAVDVAPDPREDPVEIAEEVGPSIDGPSPLPVSVSHEPAPRRPIPVSRIALAAGALAVVAIVVGWSLSGGQADPEPTTSVDVPAPIEERAEGTPPDPVEDATPIDDNVPAPETAEPPAPRVVTTSRVTEYGVGTGVVDRRLVGESDRFAAGTRVWFWTRVVDGAPGTSVDHVWTHEGREVDRIVLDVGSANWRTHSAKRIYEVGRWTVEARDPAGALLARGEFDCVAK